LQVLSVKYFFSNYIYYSKNTQCEIYHKVKFDADETNPIARQNNVLKLIEMQCQTQSLTSSLKILENANHT